MYFWKNCVCELFVETSSMGVLKKIFLTAVKCSDLLESSCRTSGLYLSIFLYRFLPSSTEFWEGNKSHTSQEVPLLPASSCKC